MTARHETEFGRPESELGFVRGAPPPRTLATRSVLWLGAAGLLLSLLVAQMGDSGLAALVRLRERSAELQTEVDGLAADIDAVEANLERLRHDREFLERIAREWYGMKGPDETVIRVSGLDGP